MRTRLFTVIALSTLALACSSGKNAGGPPPSGVDPKVTEAAQAKIAEQAAAATAAANEAAAAAAAAATTTLDQAGLDARLLAADTADGTVDHIVSKCVGCKLGMAGKAEHSVTVGAYTLHACSPECAAKITADPNAAIGALSL